MPGDLFALTAAGTTLEELRARIPRDLEEVVCRKHRPILAKLDRVLHEGGAVMSASASVAIDAITAATKSGFSAEIHQGAISKPN